MDRVIDRPQFDFTVERTGDAADRLHRLWRDLTWSSMRVYGLRGRTRRGALRGCLHRIRLDIVYVTVLRPCRHHDHRCGSSRPDCSPTRYLGGQSRARDDRRWTGAVNPGLCVHFPVAAERTRCSHDRFPRADCRLGVQVSTPHPDDSPPPKATLYCPSCGHESTTDGDWIVRVRDASVDYECPDCGTTITSRPCQEHVTVTNEGRRRYCPSD